MSILIIWIKVLRMFHIIDDANINCKIVTAMLKHQGYEAMSFGCPKDYISFVNNSDYKNPIAVFIDIVMPAMTGFEMMNVVSELKPDLRFVLMTSQPDTRSEHANKACMYLAKPITSRNLIKVVGTLIQCGAYSPAFDHKCTSADNRRIFPIKNWSCPHRSKDSSSDCS